MKKVKDEEENKLKEKSNNYLCSTIIQEILRDRERQSGGREREHIKKQKEENDPIYTTKTFSMN